MPAGQSRAEALEPDLSLPQYKLAHHPNNFRTPQTQTFHLLLAPAWKLYTSCAPGLLTAGVSCSTDVGVKGKNGRNKQKKKYTNSKSCSLLRSYWISPVMWVRNSQHLTSAWPGHHTAALQGPHCSRAPKHSSHQASAGRKTPKDFCSRSAMLSKWSLEDLAPSVLR